MFGYRSFDQLAETIHLGYLSQTGRSILVYKGREICNESVCMLWVIASVLKHLTWLKEASIYYNRKLKQTA